MNKGLAKQLLLSNNYWVLNKSMVNLLGLETAFFLSTIADADEMMGDEDGWFYQTSETIEEITTLKRHKQDQCIKKLEEVGILKKEIRGIPPKRFFKIDYECLTNQFVENQQINMSKINKSICRKSATNKEHNINNINKESIYSDFVAKILTLYPGNKSKSIRDKKLPKILKEYGEEEIIRCVTRYSNLVKNKDKQYILNEGTFWNGRYMDYLDENYKEQSITKPQIEAIDDNPFLNRR